MEWRKAPYRDIRWVPVMRPGNRFHILSFAAMKGLPAYFLRKVDLDSILNSEGALLLLPGLI